MIWGSGRSSGFSLDRLGSRTGPGRGSSSVDGATASSLGLRVQLRQATSPRAGVAGGPRLTGNRLPVLTDDTQDSDHSCCDSCEISQNKLELVISSFG